MFKKIMIVDDNLEFANTLRDSLIKAHYKVIVVLDSTKAIKIALKEKPDVFLIDLVMLNKNGYDLSREIKSLLKKKKSFNIAMSAHCGEMNSFIKDLFGFDHFMLKPFDPFDLIVEIEQLVS